MEHNIDKPAAKLDGVSSVKKYIFLVVSIASLAWNLAMVTLHVINCKTLAVGFFSLFNNDFFNTLWKLLHTCVHGRTYLHVLLNVILMAIVVKSGVLSSPRQYSSTGDDHHEFLQSQSLHAQKKAKEASIAEVSKASTMEQLISDVNDVSKQKKETRDKPESHSLFIKQTRDKPESHSLFIKQPCEEASAATASKIEKKISIVADHKQEIEETRDRRQEIHRLFIINQPCEEGSATTASKMKKKISISVADKPDEETRDRRQEIHRFFIINQPCEEVSATTASKMKKKISISVADKPDEDENVMGTDDESVGNIEKLSTEDFNRTVEAYIERQRRSWLMQRQNSLKRAVGSIFERHRR